MISTAFSLPLHFDLRRNSAGRTPNYRSHRLTRGLAAAILVSCGLPLLGTAQQVQSSATTTGTPKLSVSTTSIPFGSVTVGSSATQDVVVTSTGTAPVTVYSASLSGTGFQANSSTPLPVTLAPGKSATGYMTFAPTATGTDNASLTIVSNSSTNSTLVVSLTGTGVTAKHQVSLKWQAPSSSSTPVAGYHIYRSTGATSSYSLLHSSTSTQTSYIDSAVQNGTTYAYVVKSVSSTGAESAASDTTRATIP